MRPSAAGAVPVAEVEAGARLYPVPLGRQWGYVDRTGTVAIPARFDEAFPFAEGRARVRAEVEARPLGASFLRWLGVRFPEHSAWLLLDAAGAVRGAVDEAFVLGFAGGLVPFQTRGALPGTAGDWGYVGPDGEAVIAPRFDGASRFSEGLARVVEGGRVGFIDAAGAFAIAPRFDDAGDFSGGLARVRDGRRWGYADRTGAVVIAPRFDGALDFAEGLAVVQEGDRFGFVGPDGALAIPARFAYAGSFRNGLAFVREGRRAGYVDATGAYVWRQPE